MNLLILLSLIFGPASYAMAPSPVAAHGQSVAHMDTHGGNQGGNALVSGVGALMAGGAGYLAVAVYNDHMKSLHQNEQRELNRQREAAERIQKEAQIRLDQTRSTFSQLQSELKACQTKLCSDYQGILDETSRIQTHAAEIAPYVMPGRSEIYNAGAYLTQVNAKLIEQDIESGQMNGSDTSIYYGMNHIALTLIDISIGLHPVTGFGQSSYEFFVGKNLVTGDRLSRFERSLAFAGVLSGGLFKTATQLPKFIQFIKNYHSTYKKAVQFKSAQQMNRVVKEAIEIKKALEEIKAGQPITQTIADFKPEHLNQIIENVDILNEVRKGYVRELNEATQQVIPLALAGQPLKRIAEWASNIRRQIGIKYKSLTPEPMRTMIYDRNLGTANYKDPFGATFEGMYAKLKANGLKEEEIYEKIIQSAFNPNNNLSTFLEQAAKLRK